MLETKSIRYNSLANVVREFEIAADFLSLSPDQRSFIEEPRFSVQLKLPVRLDSGKIKVFRAYHVIHSIMRGPAIGGVQFRPNINLAMVEALAFWSTHRCALLNIPFGGSYGAVECDTASYSIGEMERISRRYVAELSELINPDNDILTADIGSNQQVMCWFMDTFSMHKGEYAPAVALGKPADLGGTLFNVYPTAAGAYLCIEKACDSLKLKIKDAKVAIQGFGKAGMNIAQLLYNAGAKVTAINDVSGAYCNENGINIPEVVWHQQSNGILDGLEGEADVCKMNDPQGMFELPVDILIPAAVELQITEQNMFGVRAKIIAEVAHDPVSPIADRYLYEKGVLIIPDILCNSGGTVGRYLEWVQNRTGYYWAHERVHGEMQKIIGSAFDSVMALARKNSASMRLAAAVLAVGRIARAAELRGVYA